ncbi:MAG: DUF2764 family protein [Kiritimatiellae bacterium]|nr:DUF2764 family protein [Kiritimatiellia bacterium]
MYTYLVASLPTLTFGEPPPWSPEDFLFRLDGVLGERERAQVAAILEDRPVSGSAFADGWQARETQLRNAVARHRAAALNVDVRGTQRPHAGYDGYVAEMVTNSLARTPPLERAVELDRCRWHVAEDLARRDSFGISTVLAFAVKLRIAQRWAAMSDETGRARVEEEVRRNTEAPATGVEA